MKYNHYVVANGRWFAPGEDVPGVEPKAEKPKAEAKPEQPKKTEKK